ncbi:MAG: PEP-CTERM sorting domain-containing protein [Planctomycetaceae bacterium]|nr:PEP-CTERM sorting domain-containing protein [Planctomycetaceae bacterium]
MIRRVLASITLALALVSSADAAILVSSTFQPTPGLAGYNTWTINLATDFDQLSTIDAKFNSPVMNQVNPLAFPTIFQDNNALFGFVGANVLQDSQFLFNTTTDSLLVVPAPTTSEGPAKLTSAFTGFSPFVSKNIAQLVIPTANELTYNIVGVTRDNTEWSAQGVFTAVPEPSSMLLAGIGGVAALLVARRRRATVQA